MRFFHPRIQTRIVLTWLTCAALVFGYARPQPASATPGSGEAASPMAPGVSVSFTKVMTGFTSPVVVTHAGDARLFVVEQKGIIKVIKDGKTLPAPFLDISDSVLCCGEEGLLGLAFEPNYKATGRFYVYHTVMRNGFSDEVIERYQVSASNADVADKTTKQEVLYIPHHKGTVDNHNHNGGWIGFGPDSLLYAGVGDGGGGGDPFCSGQSADTLLGKMLRLNVVGQVTYTVPSSNTFLPHQQPEDWAIGLRNPWRASFDRQTGELYIGDVGQSEREEVDVVPAASPAGLNFGWNRFEGFKPYSTACAASPITMTLPITDYTHAVGNAIIGGYVYRGPSYPWLNGVYFYADFGTGRLFAAWRAGSSSTFSTTMFNAPLGFQPSSFGEDASGELYTTGYVDGVVYKLTSTSKGNHAYFPFVSH